MNNIIRHVITKHVIISALLVYILGVSTLSRMFFFCYNLKYVAFLSLVLVRGTYIIYIIYYIIVYIIYTMYSICWKC